MLEAWHVDQEMTLMIGGGKCHTSFYQFVVSTSEIVLEMEMIVKYYLHARGHMLVKSLPTSPTAM